MLLACSRTADSVAFVRRASRPLSERRPLFHTPLASFCPTGRAALTFRIGPDFDSAREFVYKLGPQRLDELLSAKVVSAPPPLLRTCLPYSWKPRMTGRTIRGGRDRKWGGPRCPVPGTILRSKGVLRFSICHEHRLHAG